jgi:ribonucleoside-diphosphate reductase alpha chain
MYYDLSKYENNQVPMRDLIRHESAAYKYGLKTLYYLNSNDNSGDVSQLLAQEMDEINKNTTEKEVEAEELELIDADGCEGGACSV